MKTKSRNRKFIVSLINCQVSNCDKFYSVFGKRARWEFLFKRKISTQ